MTGMLAFAVGIGMGWLVHVRRAGVRERARLDMANFEESLQLHQSMSQVSTAFREKDYAELNLRQTNNCWAVTMPHEWGATDWILILEFQADELVAIRYRTQDGITTRPPAIQADREVPGVVASCPSTQ